MDDSQLQFFVKKSVKIVAAYSISFLYICEEKNSRQSNLLDLLF